MKTKLFNIGKRIWKQDTMIEVIIWFLFSISLILATIGMSHQDSMLRIGTYSEIAETFTDESFRALDPISYTLNHALLGFVYWFGFFPYIFGRVLFRFFGEFCYDMANVFAYGTHIGFFYLVVKICLKIIVNLYQLYKTIKLWISKKSS